MVIVMKIIVRFAVLISALAIGDIASAQDFSFSEIDRMTSYEKDFLRMAIEQGEFVPNSSSSYQDIELEGIEYGNQDDIELFIIAIIKGVCPACATTSSGSTVRVKYGNSSSSGKNAYVINSDDYYIANNIEESCEELLDDHRYERGGKDIVIVDNNDDDDKIALCFDRD